MAVRADRPANKPPKPPAKKPRSIKAAPQDCSAVNGYDWDVRTAYAICMAESGGVSHKNNAGLNSDGSVDYGLMQINSIHADMVGGDLNKLYDPQVNVKVAYALYKSSGNFTPWSAYNSGKYQQYL